MKISPLSYARNYNNKYMVSDKKKASSLSTQLNFGGEAEIKAPPYKGYMVCVGTKHEKGAVIKKGLVYNRDTTSFLRSDLDWQKLAKYLDKKYKETEKVNVYNYGCSNGAETYTLALILSNLTDKDSDKYFPIIAKDIRKSQIADNIFNKVMDDIVFYDNSSKKSDIMTQLLADNENRDYFYFINDIYNTQEIHIKPKLAKKVEFTYGNILNDVDKIDSKAPSIIFCRNMWQYIDEKEYSEFFEKLYEKLAPNSIIIIGYYDIENDAHQRHKNAIDDYILEAGFVPSISDAANKSLCPDINCLVFEKN